VGRLQRSGLIVLVAAFGSTCIPAELTVVDGPGGSGGSGAAAGSGGSGATAGGGAGGSTCGGIECAVDQCCDGTSQCVPGTSDSQCGSTGAACESCEVSGQLCGRANSLSDPRGLCLPHCAGHLQVLEISSGDLGGHAGASVLCAEAFGASWHLVPAPWPEALYYGADEIPGVCVGPWCTGTSTDWHTVPSVLGPDSCADLTSSDGYDSAEGAHLDSFGCVGTSSSCCSGWGGQFHCDGSWTDVGPFGILCTDSAPSDG
jgi:hypothetical protein